MQLTRTFEPGEYDAALATWSFLGLDGLEPWFTTAFGDVFLIGDDGVYWLDIVSGELTHAFETPEEAQKRLATDEGMDEYLLAGLAFAAAEAGLVPGATEILAYRVPPVLDGEFEVTNLVVAPFAETVRRAGELHDQIKDLPEGAEVEGFDEDSP
jgi:hypothetical protein